MTPTIELDPNAICVRIETTLPDQDSFVDIKLDSGDGYVNVTDPNTNQRCPQAPCVILRQCYDTVAGIQVSGPSLNGWKGSIKWTTDGGNSFNRFECVECTGTNDPRANTDFTVSGGESPSGGVECLDGSLCTLLRTVTGTPTKIPTESPSDLPTNIPVRLLIFVVYFDDIFMIMCILLILLCSIYKDDACSKLFSYG